MDKIKISNRLKRIAEYIDDSKKIIDIGCDHALLGIYLCMLNKDIEVIASDINEKPLIKAYENIMKYHMNERIKIKQGDGLESMEDEIDTIIISGMGSINMVNILKNVNNYRSVKNIILSPNNDFPYLRSEIEKLGFKIEKEEIIYDKNKYYLIIKFTKGNLKINNLFGKLDLNNIININYFKNLYKKNIDVLSKIDKNDEIKREEIIKENELIKNKVKL